jgi:hypothetical protein
MWKLRYLNCVSIQTTLSGTIVSASHTYLLEPNAYADFFHMPYLGAATLLVSLCDLPNSFVLRERFDMEEDIGDQRGDGRGESGGLGGSSVRSVRGENLSHC